MANAYDTLGGAPVPIATGTDRQRDRSLTPGTPPMMEGGAPRPPAAIVQPQAYSADGYPSSGPQPIDAAHPADLLDETQLEGDVAAFHVADPRDSNYRWPAGKEQEWQTLLRNGATEDQANAWLAQNNLNVTNVHQMIDARDRYHAVSNDVQYRPQGIQDLDQQDQDMAHGRTGGSALGVINSLPGLGHVAAALRAEFGPGAHSGRSFADEYAVQSDAMNTMGATAQAEHPAFYMGGQIAGAAGVPLFGVEDAGLAAAAGVLRSGGSRFLALAAARSAARDQLALNGALYGGAHGAMNADNPRDAVTGGISEAALGGATPFAADGAGMLVGDAARDISRILPRATADGRAVYEAGQRQGIDVLPADVGGPVTRRATSMTTQTIAGGQPIIAASERMIDQTQAARDRAAADIGTALRPEAAGQAATRGATAFVSRTSQRGGQLYDSAIAAAGDARIAPTQALQVLDRNIAELSETPGGSAGLSRLQALRDELARGDVSVAGMRNMRTALRDQFIEGGLTGSDLERRVNQVVDAAGQDVTNGLTAQNRGVAARLYGVADRYWRNRAATIGQVIQPLIGTNGERSGEQVVRSLTADLQGNNARAIRFIGALPEQEQSTVRASIIGALGRANPGAQNAEGDAFSLSTFLTNWNQIGESAKRAYFGPETRAALNDVAKVAQGAREASQYANRSNTAGAIGGSVFGLPREALQYVTGRVLASPRFARWLARSTNVSAQATPAYVGRLSRIARAEPQIANELLQLQDRLRSAFGTSLPTPAAANEGLDGRPAPEQ